MLRLCIWSTAAAIWKEEIKNMKTWAQIDLWLLRLSIFLSSLPSVDFQKQINNITLRWNTLSTHLSHERPCLYFWKCPPRRKFLVKCFCKHGTVLDIFHRNIQVQGNECFSFLRKHKLEEKYFLLRCECLIVKMNDRHGWTQARELIEKAHLHQHIPERGPLIWILYSCRYQATSLSGNKKGEHKLRWHNKLTHREKVLNNMINMWTSFVNFMWPFQWHVINGRMILSLLMMLFGKVKLELLSTVPSITNTSIK